MTSTEVAYKTADPAIVAAWKSTAEQIRDIGNRAVDEAERIGKNKGLMIRRGLDEERFVGLAPIDPSDPPEGWRYVREQFEPRRGRAGEQAAAWLASVQLPSVREAMKAHGMPNIVFKGGFMRTPGMFLHNDTIWVRWGDEPDADEIGPAWQKCRLSEFYAAQEDSEQVSA